MRSAMLPNEQLCVPTMSHPNEANKIVQYWMFEPKQCSRMNSLFGTDMQVLHQ